MPYVRVSEETMKELRMLRAWFELNAGERYSLDKVLRETITEFNKTVTIPWEEIKKHGRMPRKS